MPSKRRSNNKRLIPSSKSNMTKATSEALMLRPLSEARIVRNFMISTLMTTDGAGNLRQAVDISATYSIQADFTSVSALFTCIRVKKLTVSIIPIVKFYSVGTTSVYPNFALGYSVGDTALASYAQVTELSSSTVYAGKRLNMSFTPKLKVQTVILEEVINNADTNLGKLMFYNLYALVPTTSFVIQNLVMTAEFWGQK